MSGGKLPEGWVNSKFTDLMDVQGGTQPPKSEFIPEAQNGYIRLLQIRDFGKKPVPTYIPETKKLKTCREEDLLIGRYGASLGRICTGHAGAYNVALAKVIYPHEFERSFIRYYLESEIFQFPLRLLSRSAQNGFNKEDLSRFDFLLAPLAEQKILAEKLDTLLAQVDSTKTRLEQIPQILKRFRQAVLAAVVNGKSVNTDIDENILTTLGNIAKNIKYGTSKKCSETQGSTAVLRIPNIGPGYIINSNLKYADFDQKELVTLTLKEGDLLLIRSNGSVDLVGKVAVISENDTEYLYAGYLIRVRLNKERAAPKYISYCLQSPQLRQVIENIARSTSGVNNINSKELASLEIPLPPLPEQHEIVRSVEQLFAYADTIEKQVNSALTRVNSLTQSILAKAFRGELTAQWRAENPDLISGENSAAALLEKIKAERAASGGKKTSRKKA
ncbi:restriction endonuclease subunit S [Citrobacter sp. Cpo074]|uniref:restriction endonuclease subunit S n=1 Tax=Citrobacter sp. Cpo074 TaxID=2985135 RepID=UPI0025771297|nr:restriction endonuclease subunit S [Citrobacter sp. Cpo074]MDM2847454.1 restriction endonuclease subunit S [Citrobacter sp. Cpo074]